MDDYYTQFDSVFFEKTRLSIMTVLYNDGIVSFNQLKRVIGGTDGALYAHLEKLIKAGYAEKRKELAESTIRTVYQIREEGRIQFIDYLSFIEKSLKKNR